MKPPFILRSRRAGKLHRQAGITMLLVAMAMVAIIAMAALSIDVVTLYLARMEAQRSADAAALAAARVISLSGITGDPSDSSGSWALICGGSSSPATLAAVASATQNVIGAITPTVTVTYFTVGTSPTADCSGLPAAFGVNPLVTAQVTRSNLPTFFSRMWGNTGNTVTATATAEAFNASNSANIGNGPTGTITPVQPRCVKPWMVPNQDPLYQQPTGGNYCNQSGGPGPCTSLVDISSGQIQHPGVSLNGTGAGGVIGETFWLSPDCTHTGSGCTFRTQMPKIQPYANFTGNPYVPNPPNLLYVPGQAPTAIPVAVPSCSSGQDLYQQAVAGCDQSTVYQCGVQNMNTVDLSQNPDYDTSQGVQCLIDEGSPNTSQPDGQDTLNPYAAPSSYPFQILAGSSNPLLGAGLATGTPITSSASIVSLPIYDSTQNINTSGTTQVTVVGFLQVFINQVDQYGTMSVTVLNVTGCSNGQGQPVGTAVTGSSPVPVRLITAP
ncbi:exported hypothetical protein [Candidatus Sulfotelmatobacter kueseliae]|uniref:Putative Flp pilus-assembly TadG-like N-terminal domain-containing protein n=1 Tax=Candidatus Sulfotelmatobacter kueseliae TaxID=2042962 RepID=A0A2U3LDH2_9BACT|nr:exported hypothetical protein [Candidatus Sulfotelmatobacter kueseliae]